MSISFCKSSEGRALRNQALRWQNNSLATLSDSRVIASLGPERCKTLTDIIGGLGVIAVGSERHSVRSTNDGHILAVPKLAPKDCLMVRGVYIPTDRSNGKNVRSAAGLITASTWGSAFVVLIPGKDKFTSQERAAIMAHEATHVKQFVNGDIKSWHGIGRANKTKNEVEAYGVSLNVLDPYYEGDLGRIVDVATIDYDVSYNRTSLNIPKDKELDSLQLLASSLRTVPWCTVSQVVASRQFGYTADSPHDPPANVVNLFSDMGLIN